MYAVSLSTLAVAGYAWQPLWGGHSFVVIAKATFQLLPGKARLADVQDDLNLVDNHWDDDANCSVYAPSDMAPFKERADVMLVGDAFAPTARGSKSLVARVSVGNMSKSLVVFSDRCIDQRGRISHGERFNRMALRYERATASDVNPVGIAPGCVKGQPLPNLQAVPRKQSEAERVDTACFAPIAARWPTRQRLLGSAAAGWDETAWRHTPLPCQVDTTYFNASPADQRVDEIRCDERIVLNHLHPQHARLVSHLPGMQPRAFVERCAAVRPVSLRADSLWIDTTRGICTVTWRGSVELQSADEPGRVLVALERDDEHLTWPDVEAMAPPQSGPTSAVRLASATHADSQSELPARRTPLPTLNLEMTPCPAPPISCPPRPISCAPPPISAPPPPISAPPPPTSAPMMPPPSRPWPSAPAIASAAQPTLHPTASPWLGGTLGALALKPPPSPSPQHVVPPPLMTPVAQVLPPPNRATNTRQPHSGSRTTSPRGVELLGFEHSAAERVSLRWSELCAEPADEPFERELRDAFDATQTMDRATARSHMVRVLKHAQPTTAASMHQALHDAIDEDGMLVAPLVVAHGSLRFVFDETETLDATLAAVAAQAADDEELSAAIEDARGILERGARNVSPDVAAQLTARIHQLAEVDCGFVERVLLERRAYQKRTLLSGQWVRALLDSDSAEASVPVYLPEQMAQAAPMFTQLDAQLIAELHPRQDQYETSPQALRVMAFGRVIHHEEATR